MTTNYHTAIATEADAAAATFNAPLGALDAAIGTLATMVSGKAAAVHTHAIADVTSLQTTLDGKAAAVHTHDDRYYTESETDTLLSGKAAAVHTHAIGDVTSLQTTLDGKAASVHTHGAADVTAGTFGAGAYTFTTSVSAPVIVGTNAAAATEGANAISNGTFDSDTAWTKGTGWSIAGGVATKTAGTAAALSQAVSGIAAGQVVRVRFDYTRTAGALTVICGSVTYNAGFYNASESVDIYIVTTGTGTLQFSGDASFAGTVDNVQATIITPRTLAVQLPTVGTGNVSAGANALENVTTGTGNTALGVEAGRYITIGADNVAIGYRALSKNQIGAWNIAIGREALRDGYILNTTTVNSNVAIGYQALASLVFNHSNVAIGYGAGSAATGINSSVMVGREAGRSGSGGSVMLGTNAGYSETGANRLYISNSNTTTPLIYGLFSGTGAGVTIYSQETNGTPLQVRAKASQTNDLQRWQNSSGTALSVVTAGGAVGVMSATVSASTALEIGGTDGAVLLPRLTTTQRDALTAADGMVIYNTTAAKLQGRAGGAWVDLH